jgi:pimeloyl-ACP methyl ester carboxylesterase
LLPFLPTAEEATQFKAGIDPGDMRPFIDGLVPGLFTPATPPPVRTTVIAQLQQTAPQVLAGLMTDVAVVTGPPFAPGTLQRPTLVLASTGPDTPPAHETQVRSAFPLLDYRAFPGTGHYLMIERAREVNDAIAGFLLGRALLR